MQLFKTVLGDVSEDKIGITLPHEHICCYSEYVYKMLGSAYLDKEALVNNAVNYLNIMKRDYNLKTFIDCTPVNIGRDIELLKEVSRKTGVNIICSTGFYYTEESVLNRTSAEDIANYIVTDAKNINAGIIKCGVEYQNISPFNEKMLKATAMAQLKLNLPIVLHSNAKNQNGLKALEILLSEGVRADAITVGHLSDTDDIEYIKTIAQKGCFIGLDRLYDIKTEEYISKTVDKITQLCESGYEDKILLSHDSLVFSGFDAKPEIKKPRYNYCFDNILPLFSADFAEKVMNRNVVKMLGGK